MQPNHVEPQQDRRLLALSTAFVLFNVLDAYLTLLAIDNGAIELNPIMRKLLAQPDWVFWSTKISWVLIFTLSLIIAASKWPHQVNRILTILVITTVGICLLNTVGVVL